MWRKDSVLTWGDLASRLKGRRAASAEREVSRGRSSDTKPSTRADDRGEAPGPSRQRLYAHEAEELESSVDGVDLKLWKIALGASKKKPVYEIWALLVDNGTAFPAGSATPSAVHMIQGRFMAEGKKRDAATEQLVRELEVDVPF